MKSKEIVDRYNAEKAGRSEIESVWRDLERFVMPLRSSFFSDNEAGNTPNYRRREVYDSTATQAALNLAAALKSNLVPESIRWFDLRFSNDEANSKDKNREWSDNASDILFYSLQKSNFNLQIAESFLDIVTFGTSALIEEIDGRELVFDSVPIKEVYFEEGAGGNVPRFYRRLEWTALQVVDKFGEKGLPERIIKAYKNPQESQLFEICFCVYQRTGMSAPDLSKPVSPKLLPFGYKYIMSDTSEELGEEGGYYSMPTFISRWATQAGDKWGYAPGLAILSDIMFINQWMEALITSAEKMVEPPMMTTQRGLLGDLDMRRGGLTIVNDMNDLGMLPVGGDVTGIGGFVLADHRMMIRRAFYEDQLNIKESPQMTATEANIRFELMQRYLGATVSRLQSDLLDPMIERSLGLLIRAGVIPMPPEGAMEDGELTVEYVGPLPRAQKADRASSMLGWAGQIVTLSEQHPDLNDIPNWDKLFTLIGIDTGVPAVCINSEVEIRTIREERAKAQQAMVKAEEEKAQGEAMTAVGKGTQEMNAADPSLIGELQGSVPPRDVR